MSSPFTLGHRVFGIPPQLVGRDWEKAARDLQEFLSLLKLAGEGMPSDEAMEQIVEAVVEGASSDTGLTNTRLTYALLLFGEDC